MVLQFYYHPQSPPCQTVWMLLKELGIEYESKIVDLMTGQQKTEDYMKISPLHKVPAIKDGDFVLTDSRAIAIYLCQKHEPSDKENKLYPTNMKDAAKINMDTFSDLDSYHDVLRYINVLGVFYGTSVGPVDEYLPKIKSWLGNLQSRLNGRTFLSADHMTIVDFYALVGIGLLESAGFPNWDEFPEVQRWRNGMETLSYFEECFAKPCKLSKEFYQRQVQKFKDEHPEN